MVVVPLSLIFQHNTDFTTVACLLRLSDKENSVISLRIIVGTGKGIGVAEII